MFLFKINFSQQILEAWNSPLEPWASGTRLDNTSKSCFSLTCHMKRLKP